MFVLSCNKCHADVGAVREPPLQGLSLFYPNLVLGSLKKTDLGYGERIFAAARQSVKFLYDDIDFLKIMIINKADWGELDASGEI